MQLALLPGPSLAVHVAPHHPPEPVGSILQRDGARGRTSRTAELSPIVLMATLVARLASPALRCGAVRCGRGPLGLAARRLSSLPPHTLLPMPALSPTMTLRSDGKIAVTVPTEDGGQESFLLEKGDRTVSATTSGGEVLARASVVDGRVVADE